MRQSDINMEIDGKKVSYIFIDTPRDCKRDLLGVLQNEKYVAIDTEFTRRNTYYAIPSLLQIAYGDSVIIFDWQMLAKHDDFHFVIKELLGNSRICKVMHSASQDIEIFFCHGIRPQNILDTQVAMNFCVDYFGEKRGLDILVQKALGGTMSKAKQRSDWYKRPLKKSQIDYAAYDAYNIYHAYKKLNDMLDVEKRQFYLDDCAELLDKSRYQVDYYKLATKFMRKLRVMPEKLLAYKLLMWREIVAQLENKVRAKVMQDEDILQCARSKRWPRFCDKTMITLSDEEITKEIIECEKRDIELRQINLEVIDKLRKKVCEVSKKLNIDATYFASMRDIQQFYLKRSSKLAKGWRYEIIGSELNKILKQYES